MNVIKSKAKIGVIGSGYAGLASASVLAQSGFEVEIFEKNETIGGRARHFESNGFVFDMGPSWYWMPDVFEKFYKRFGKSASDFYDLKKLDPGFAVIFDKHEVIDIPADFDELCSLFESIETGSSAKLKKFMVEAEYKYKVGINNLVYQPGLSVNEFLDFDLIKGIFRLQVFTSLSSHVRKYFKNPKLISLLEFPVLFLGAMPKDTPALYSLMNYAGLKQGTFYPMGGFGKTIDAFRQIASECGVQIKTSQNVESINVNSGKTHGLTSNGVAHTFDALVGAADYHHIENSMLDEKYISYPQAYWDKKTFAPSSLIYYIGVKKKINKLRHHNLFFDADFDLHQNEIYTTKKWPESPLFYVCCPSKTDPSVAPEGYENLFFLMPLTIGLSDSEETREQYYRIMMSRLESFTGEKIEEDVIYKKSYCVSDFKKDYNAYKGNAYGLANTLLQTAIFKPKIRSKKVSNLFYAGQLTVPGPGVPPSIISGQVAAAEIIKYFKKNN